MSLRDINFLKFTSKKSVPLISQSEISECGLACTVMVCSYFGYESDIATLRNRFPVSAHGTTLEEVIDNFSEVGFSSRALRLEIDEIRKLKTPCILHWDMNHFVVLVSNKKRFIIHDPATGRQVLNLNDLSKHFTGIALEVSPAPNFKKKIEKVKLGLFELIKPASGLLKSFIIVLVLSFAIQVFALVAPYFSQVLIDKIIPRNDFSLLNVLGVGFIFLAIFHTLVDNLRSWFILHQGSLLSVQVYSKLMLHLLKLPLEFFEKRHLGDIASRFGSLDEIQRLLTTGFVQGVVDGTMVVITLIIMFFYSAKLTLVALLSLFLFAFLQFIVYRTIREKSENIIVQGAKNESAFLETVSGIQSVKSFAKESSRHNYWLNKYANYLNATIELGKFNIWLGILHGIIAGVEGVVLVWLAGYEILSASGFSVGMFFAFMAYSGRFAGQSKALVGLIFEFKMLGLHLERVADIALKPEEELLKSRSGVSNSIEGELCLVDASFKYGQKEDWVFKNLNLHIRKGEKIVITGKSGCGKTTLLKVLMGLLKQQEGKLLIDSKELKEFGLRDYRKQSASVMQNDDLFSGSIIENISFFDPKVDLELVKTSAYLAGVMSEIESMPMKFHTFVGSMGMALSGGQKQRILLARALYARPKILFLDEATSHLDNENEKIINDSLNSLNITIVMIAHRESTIKLADREISLG